MPDYATCPDRYVLQLLMSGRIAEPEAESLHRHLAGCEQCAESLSGVKAADTLTEALRGGEDVLGRLDGEEVRALMQRLETMSWSGGVERELRTVLAPARGAGEIGRVGPYRVLKVLGAGGMGIVLQVEHPGLLRVEALKLMRPALAADESARRRFLQEARAMAAVKHPHVVAVYHVSADGADAPFLTMEYLEGETLGDRLQRQPLLPTAEVLRIGRETAEGLAAAHERGLIHRDVKPANVWLEGDAMHVKVLDFGLARPAVDGGSRLTQSSLFMGTPAYMPPEQVDGQPTDARGDLFSLGCMLYRMTTGELPFQGDRAYAVLKAVSEHQPRPPRDRNRDLPPELSALVMRLLEKDPARRPASAREVVETIQALERRPAGLAPAPTECAVRPGGPKKPGRRWRWFAAAAAAVVFVLIPVGVLCGPTVVRVVTNKGVLVIETDDVSVEVTARGQAATIIDPRTKREIEVRAGDQEVEVRELPDGLHFFTKTFTLSRGGTEIVHVREEMARAEAAPPAKPLTAEVRNSLDMKLVLIPAGEFLMGSPKNEQGREDIEGPQHKVQITRPFYLGSCPVTKGQFAAFVQDDGYQTEAEADGKGGWCFSVTTDQWEQKPEYTWRHAGFPQTNEHPVVQVTWNDARAFCEWLSKKEEKSYELPTEAEWEYACRAGTTTRFWGGDSDLSLEGNANVADASLKEKLGAAKVADAVKNWTFGAWDDGYPFTAPAGSFKANPWGLYDMHGNVWQWCADRYGPYLGGSVQDPTGPDRGPDRVFRGGSWPFAPQSARSACRGLSATNRYDVGFRVALRPGANAR